MQRRPRPVSLRPAAREYLRVEAQVRVHGQLSGGRTVDGQARDLSLGGAFIVCSPVVQAGDEVTLSLDAVPALVLPATVRWVAPDGFGVQFAALQEPDRLALEQLMRERPFSAV